MALTVDRVTKQFKSKLAVDDVSFEVPRGSVFGLLGPNGAGKTTLIRMLLDILKPDSGAILFDGIPLTASLKERISYLPEERGLYRKMKVADLLEYFARLKGMSSQRARESRVQYLARLDMDDTARQRVEELSKGNQQKIQILSVLISEPDVVILDEPFSGLDPINSRETKLLLEEEKAKGRTIILSTHQMNQAEELCDYLVMIHNGRRVLYGSLEDIVAQHSEDALLVESAPLPLPVPGIHSVMPNGRLQKVYCEPGVTPAVVLRNLLDAGVHIHSFRRASNSLENIFIKVAQENGQGI